jgi:gamma-glutamyltranspeptidase
MVAAVHPLAVDAGLQMLEAGGNAVYAAIAVQLVLALVEPHACGPGGGAFLLHYDAQGHSIQAYDGRETAPMAETPELFMREGRVMSLRETVTGGLAVGSTLRSLAAQGTDAFYHGNIARDIDLVNAVRRHPRNLGLLAGHDLKAPRPDSAAAAHLFAEAGMPPGAKIAMADDRVEETGGTSHIAVVDGAGNAVAPGKRPRSSMAPRLVFDAAGGLHLVVGSPGGSQIINYVAQTLVATLDWGLDIQAAIALPHVGSRNGPTELERGTAAEQLAAPLRALGHDVLITDMTSGLHGIQRSAKGWQGGADPRREGMAKGR